MHRSGKREIVIVFQGSKTLSQNSKREKTKFLAECEKMNGKVNGSRLKNMIICHP